MQAKKTIPCFEKPTAAFVRIQIIHSGCLAVKKDAIALAMSDKKACCYQHIGKRTTDETEKRSSGVRAPHIRVKLRWEQNRPMTKNSSAMD